MKPAIFAPQLAPGEITHISSLYAEFKRGTFTLETINWAWLCGLPVHQPLESTSDLILFEAVMEDVEEWINDMGESGSFIKALSTSPKAFVGRAIDLDPELFAALDLLSERMPDPIAHVRGRALEALLR